MASGLLPKSPVSSSLWDEVPHIFIPKSHLEPREFLISSAKRLLQHNRHIADIRGTATFCLLLGKSGHWQGDRTSFAVSHSAAPFSRNAVGRTIPSAKSVSDFQRVSFGKPVRHSIPVVIHMFTSDRGAGH